MVNQEFAQNSMNNNGMNNNSFGNNGILFSSNTNNNTNNLFTSQGNATGSNNILGNNTNNNTLANSNNTSFGLSLKPTNNPTPDNYNSSSMNTRSKTYHSNLGTTQRMFEISTGGKDKDFKIHAISSLPEYANMSLDELRKDDYNNIKSGILPDNWKAHVRNKISMLQNVGCSLSHLEQKTELNQSLFSSSNNNFNSNSSFLKPSGLGNNGFNSMGTLNNNNNIMNQLPHSNNSNTGTNNVLNSSRI